MQSEGIKDRSHLLIRAIYRLALAGIDVNAKDARGRTALVQAVSRPNGRCAVKAGYEVDQSFIRHLLRIGKSFLIQKTNCILCLNYLTNDDNDEEVMLPRAPRQELSYK